MYGAVGTLDELERRSEEAKGWALLAKNARYSLTTPMLLGFVSRALKRLVGVLTPERLEQLSTEDARGLVRKLQDLHGLLTSFSRLYESGDIPKIGTSVLVRKIQDRTEDLVDIIEDLVLADNEQFKQIVSGCVTHITAAHRGRM